MSFKQVSSGWMRGALVILVLVGVALGGIGFLHTPMGRGLPMGMKILTWMGVACPLDRSGLTATQVEASRRLGVQALAGAQFARIRPALEGLELDVTSVPEALAWARSRGIACQLQVKGMRFLRCPDVNPAAFTPVRGVRPIHLLTLAFDPADRLVAVDVFRRKLDSSEASGLMQGLTDSLKKRLGQPTEAMGDFTQQALSGPTMTVALMNFRYKDYLAMLTASYIPWSGGITVHEQYSSIHR